MQTLDYGAVRFLDTTAYRRDSGVLFRLDFTSEWLERRPDVQEWLDEYAVEAWSGGDYLIPAAEGVEYDEKCPNDVAVALTDLFVAESLEGETIVLWIYVLEGV